MLDAFLKIHNKDYKITSCDSSLDLLPGVGRYFN